jgi:hypothetical protein
MTRQFCAACEFFAPAESRTEKRLWGHCLRLVKGNISGSAGKPRRLFTWVDNHCEDFQARQPCSSPRGTAGI